MSYLPRTIEPFLATVNSQFPVLLINGPRQVGKTTVLQHLSRESRTYVTLDDPILLQLAKTEPALFLDRFPSPLLIDEIQYAPELLPYIKMIVDREQKKGLFWLTGSQQFELMKGVTESLAGRVAIMHLLGLSLKEQEHQAKLGEPFLPTEDCLQKRVASAKTYSLLDIYRMIWRGSYPAICLSSLDRDIFYSSYIQTYLQRDVRDLANIGNIHVFLKFLRATAARTGQLLNMADLARDTGISPMTARNWISILEASGIIFLLEPYHNNLNLRLIKTPKLYFLDTGLCAYLTGWSSPETLEAGAMSGAILETFIFSEILKSYWHNGKSAPLYYYRDKDKKEIDLLIVKDDVIYPLEFKKTANMTSFAVSQFDVLKKLNKTIGPGGVICLVQQLIPLNKMLNAIPVGLL
jgi:predicted AAA+ superfamily ATPase